MTFVQCNADKTGHT